MKKPIYVLGPNASPLTLASQNHVVAIRPAARGEKKNWCLASNGRLVAFEGLRFGGVGIERYLLEHGYRLATDTDRDGVKLHTSLQVREGIEHVEQATVHRAQDLQKRLGGMTCTFVPFDPESAPIDVLVSEYEGIASFSFSLDAAEMNSGLVNVKDDRVFHVALTAGTLIEPGQDATTAPRSTAYGGIVELAAFIIANSGLARLGTDRALEVPRHGDDDELRGRMELLVGEDGDRVVVGIDGADELVVRYLRQESVLARCDGLQEVNGRLSLRAAVGSIARIFIVVAELDAKASIRKAKKAA